MGRVEGDSSRRVGGIEGDLPEWVGGIALVPPVPQLHVSSHRTRVPLDVNLRVHHSEIKKKCLSLKSEREMLIFNLAKKTDVRLDTSIFASYFHLYVVLCDGALIKRLAAQVIFFSVLYTVSQVVLESDRAEVPFLHVVVLAAPAEELADEPVHPPELRRSEQCHPAERTAVRIPGKKRRNSLDKNS